ncbi:MAG: dihydropyrimidinase [Trueperaceae bacterium]|nr:dihydropyrimidinase [Trueperaceae bacterium]
MGLLIKNGEIITADSRYHADIYCEDETITKIAQHIEAPEDAEVIDAQGKYVFPGFIDPHVHIYLPFMSTFAKDTHETGSKAALMGGTTSFIEMLAPSRGEDLMEGYELWTGKAEGNSYCDYSFHIGISKFDGNTEAQLREIVAGGMASFKVFLAYKNFFGVNDEELYKTLMLAKELGVIVTAHCENDELVAQLQQTLLAQGKTGPEWHEPSRPERVEADGTHHFATFLEMTGAKGYIVHLSCEPTLKVALEAKSRGVDLAIESVIPHFVLDKCYAERANYEGAKYIMSPPLRDKENQQALWNALAQGMIDTVATDHCPFDLEQKDMGKGDFTKIPNGMPAIEERIKLLYTYGVSRGNLSIHRFVDAASTRVAKLFGLEQKGQIAVGKDADLVIFDPNQRGTISAKTHHMNNDYSAFEGWDVDGQITDVTVRGKVAVSSGKFQGTKGRGKLIKRKTAGA